MLLSAAEGFTRFDQIAFPETLGRLRVLQWRLLVNVGHVVRGGPEVQTRSATHCHRWSAGQGYTNGEFCLLIDETALYDSFTAPVG